MAIRKALLALSLAILAPIPCFAGSIGVNQFSGLDTQDNPSALQPSQSQDLLNVRLQPGGRSVFKRDGFGLFQALNSISTATVHGGYHFQQTGGADVQLWGSDTGLYASINDASFVLIATGTVGSTWQCTDNLGFAYCVTSSGIDIPVKTDGSLANTSYQPSIPSGTIIASTPLQLIVGGVSGNASTIYVSANNNFLNFTPGPLPTDPYVEIINSPGSRLTHLGYYFGNIYWWKDQSMGYISGSASQGTVGITIISNQIGTLDNSSAFWNPTTYDQGNKFNSGAGPTNSGNPYFNEMQQLGGIFFRGQDGHFYQHDGYSLTRLSRIITPNITASSRRKANSWTQTTQADFNNGSAYSSFTDTTSVPGAVVLPALQITAATFATATTQALGTSSQNASSGTVILSSAGASAVSVYSENWALLPNQFDHRNSYISFTGRLPNLFGFTKLQIGVSDSTTTLSSTHGFGIELWNEAPPLVAGGGQLDTPGAGSAGGTLFTVKNPNDTLLHTISMSIDGTSKTGTLFIDGISQGTESVNWPASGPQFLIITCGSFSSLASPCELQQANVSISTGTYYSAVDNAPNLSTWGSLTQTDLYPGNSSITYFSRSSTNAFTATSSTPLWVSQPKNTTVTTSTGTFFQVRADFFLSAATETPTLNDFTFNWFEGFASDKAYIQYFQDAILFSVSSSSRVATNNTIYYLDLLNSTWLKDDIVANGFLVENNALYIGSPLTASVYRFGGVTTDNALPIHAYWKSMDFTGQDPTVQNNFDQADFGFAEASTTVSYVYTIDQSSSVAVSIPLYSLNHSIVKRGFSLTPGRTGTYYNFKIDDNSSSPAWTLMGQRTTYEPLPWRPQLTQ